MEAGKRYVECVRHMCFNLHPAWLLLCTAAFFLVLELEIWVALFTLRWNATHFRDIIGPYSNVSTNIMGSWTLLCPCLRLVCSWYTASVYYTCWSFSLWD